MSEVYEKDILVKNEHLDALEHVNNVVWLQWVQDMAAAHWQARTTPEIEAAYLWVVIDHFIEYKRPAFLGETITARTFIEKNEGVRSVRKVEFFKAGKLCVSARTNWCLLDKNSNKPRRVPEEIVELFIKDEKQ